MEDSVVSFNHKEVVVKIYELCYRQSTNNQGFVLDLKMNRQEKVIENFLKLLDKKYKLPCIGLNWLVNYFSFQFHYWQTKDSLRSISLPWVIGPKAFERWLEIEDFGKEKYWIEKESKIDFTQFLTNYSNSQDYVKETSLERRHKLMYFNSDIGFSHCLQHTTLYSKGKTCFSCVHKEKCKELLKVNFPQLYKLRMKND